VTSTELRGLFVTVICTGLAQSHKPLRMGTLLERLNTVNGMLFLFQEGISDTET